jgi:hypothetical protein
MVSVTFCSVLSSIGGQTAWPIGLKIGTNTHWNYAMKIADPECAFMRAQMCAQHRTYRLNPKLVQTPIRAMGTSYGGRRARRARSAQTGRRSRPARARSARTSAKRESTGIEQGAATAASAKFECGARAAKKYLHILRQTQLLERVIRRSRICVQPPTDTGSSIYIYPHPDHANLFIRHMSENSK